MLKVLFVESDDAAAAVGCGGYESSSNWNRNCNDGESENLRKVGK